MNKHAKQPDGMSPKLDALLREWHDVNAEHAAHGRDLLVEQLREARRAEQARAAAPRLPGPFAVLAGIARRMVGNRYTPALASAPLRVGIIPLPVARPRGTAAPRWRVVPWAGGALRLEYMRHTGEWWAVFGAVGDLEKIAGHIAKQVECPGHPS